MKEPECSFDLYIYIIMKRDIIEAGVGVMHNLFVYMKRWVVTVFGFYIKAAAHLSLSPFDTVIELKSQIGLQPLENLWRTFGLMGSDETSHSLPLRVTYFVVAIDTRTYTTGRISLHLQIIRMYILDTLRCHGRASPPPPPPRPA